MDTIFAVSSGRPPAAIAVIRVSGGHALDAARALCGTVPPPRQASLRRLRHDGGNLLDRALVLVFPGPDSATGEDIVELHVHGGRAVVAAVARALSAMPGLRAAEPGEFTRRALIHGRIDLAEAEGLADLLAAETEGQRIAALGSAEGRVSASVRGWLDETLRLSALAEAVLDHAEEDDVAASDHAIGDIQSGMTACATQIRAVLANPPIERLRDGIRVVLAGPPNAGKSTLFNILADRDAAIVSPIAGTTRDRIEAPVVRDGVAYVLIDTAGLADATDDMIEAIGIARAQAAIMQADLVLWLGDEAPDSDAIWLHARADIDARRALPPGRLLAVSRGDDASITALWRLIGARVAALLPQPDRLALNQRQRDLCCIAASALMSPHEDVLIAAEQLRAARDALASILGVNATAAMLDNLFSRFCLGK